MRGLSFEDCDAAVDSGITSGLRYNKATCLTELYYTPSRDDEICNRMGRIARTTPRGLYVLLQSAEFRDPSNTFGLYKHYYGVQKDPLDRMLIELLLDNEHPYFIKYPWPVSQKHVKENM